jgi:hypothetical protein
MMGRLQTWIDRLGRPRRGSRRADGRLARQRPLSFELCESRLALSAASLVAGSSDDSVSYVDLMSDLWARTPGTDAWTQVSFGLVQNPVTPLATLPVDLSINPAALPSLRENVMEGGLIAFNAFGNGALQNLIVNRQSSAVVDAAFDRFNSGLLFEDTTASLAGADLGPITQDIQILPSDVDTTQSWNFEPTDVPDLLGEAESTSPMVEGGALTTTPPILRITVPLDPARNEGGRIDLTAMAGPTSLDRQSSGSLAAQSAAPRVAARTGDDLPAAASNQNLRARRRARPGAGGNWRDPQWRRGAGPRERRGVPGP